MNNIKLQVYCGVNLLNEFEIEEDKIYTIGSGANSTIPIFDENFPEQLLTFQRVGDFIAIKSKHKDAKFPPSLKLPTSFIYKEYKFSFKRLSIKNIHTNIAKLSFKKNRKNLLITCGIVFITVTAIFLYIIISYLNNKKLTKEFNNDMSKLSKLQSDKEITKTGSILVKKYKDTKYEKIIQQKIDELLTIKNEYISLLERLRYNAKYRMNYHELSKLLRMRRKILKTIKWESYKKEAEKLLNKIRLKMIYIKHKAFLDILKELIEQIKNGRFREAYNYYDKVLVNNKFISTKYKNIFKKKLDIALEKDKDNFEKELLTFVNNQKLDEAENLIRIKINTYPAEYTQYFKGFLKQILEVKEELERSKAEKEFYKKEENHQSPTEKEDDQKKSLPIPGITQEEEKEKQQQEKITTITDNEIIQTIIDKNFDKLKLIFENEEYKFNISSEVYSFAKIFINLNDNCAQKKPFEYSINKVKKLILSCSIDNVTIKEKNTTKNIKLKEMGWDDIYNIILRVEQDFESKVTILKFAERLGIEKNLSDFLGYLYITHADKREEVKNLVRKYIDNFKNKNPVWSTDNKWISQEEIICSNLAEIAKRKRTLKEVLDYLTSINNDKDINLTEVAPCTSQLKNFLTYIISLLKSQYNAVIDNLFNAINTEIDELKKEIVKVIRSNEYLKSVEKKGEGVEWNPNAPSVNKYQQFLDDSNRYLDNIFTNPWESKTAKDQFKDLDKLMVIYKFFEDVDKEVLLVEFLKEWDKFWKPKWEQLVKKRFESLAKIDEYNERIFTNLKKSNQITDDEIECVKLINKYRTKLGLNALMFNKKLYDGAGIHAKYLDKLASLQKKNKKELSLSHFQVGTDTPKPDDRAKKAGYKPTMLVENIAYTPNENKNTAEWAVEGWKHSPYHHNGLITPGVLEIGCYHENFTWVLLLGSEK